MSDDLRSERVIHARPARVFEAFTTPGGQTAFYGQDDPGWIVESSCELRVGGVWAVTFGPARDHLFRHWHRFQVIDPPRRLVLATTEFRADGSRLDFTTEFTFADHDGRTLMTMIQTGLPTPELLGEHARGLPNAFDRLQGFTQALGAAPSITGATRAAERRKRTLTRRVSDPDDATTTSHTSPGPGESVGWSIRD